LEKKMKKCLFVCLLALSGAVNATVINFGSGLDPLFNYSEVETQDTNANPNSGYDTVGAYTGFSQVAFNPFEAPSSTFSWANPGETFDLNSFVIAGAWGRQTLTIEGLLHDVVQHSALLAVDNNAVALFSPGWLGIDGFRITIGNDYVQANNVDGDGQHWALDNLTVNESVSVPEPTSVALLGLGLAGGFLRKKKGA
jgi:hypothetical protein